MKMRVPVVAAAMVWLAVCGEVSPAAPQGKKPPPPANRPNRPAPKPQRNPAQELDQFQKMTPDQREKALAKLPPERRARMEKQLSRYENLTPAQKAQVQRRLEMLQALPPGRQKAVRQELQQLRAMPPAERRQRLNSEEESQHFSPEEMELLHGTVGQGNRF